MPLRVAYRRVLGLIVLGRVAYRRVLFLVAWGLF